MPNLTTVLYKISPTTQLRSRDSNITHNAHHPGESPSGSSGTAKLMRFLRRGTRLKLVENEGNVIKMFDYKDYHSVRSGFSLVWVNPKR